MLALGSRLREVRTLGSGLELGAAAGLAIGAASSRAGRQVVVEPAQRPEWMEVSMSLVPLGRRRRALILVPRPCVWPSSGGLPYLVVGQGPPLVVLSGFTAEHANPTGAARRFALRPLQPLAVTSPSTWSTASQTCSRAPPSPTWPATTPTPCSGPSAGRSPS